MTPHPLLALGVVPAAVLAVIRYGPIDLRSARARHQTLGSQQHQGPAMPAFTHPDLKCRICVRGGASQVVEAKVLPEYATSLDEVESHRELSCEDTFCLGVLAKWADAGDSVHVATYPIRSRAEAEAISGDELGEASR